MERTEPRSRRRALARGAAALAALAACAFAVSPNPPPDRLLASLAAGIAARGPLLRALSGSGFALLLGAGAGMALAVAVAAILDALRGGKPGSAGKRNFRRRSFATSLIVYALLMLASALLRRPPQAPQGAGAPPSPASASASGAAAGGGVPGVSEPSAGEEKYRVPFMPLAAAGAAAAAVGAAIAFAARARRRRRLAAEARPAPSWPEAEAEAEAAAAAPFAPARRALEADGSARSAIVRCYAAMCDLFARGSTFGPEAASPALTARELAALLRSKGAADPEIASLTAAFEKARYSDEDCGEPDRAEAIRALSAIELAYGRGGDRWA